jgi:hypothetical protein
MDRSRAAGRGVELPHARGLSGATLDWRAVYVPTRTIATPAAYAVAGLSVIYAVLYLGVVVPSGGANTLAVLITDLAIALSGLAVTIVAVTVGERIAGAEGSWIQLVGVGWALLSATHGAFAFAADLDQLSVAQISSTDPRGFATFGLGGIWMIGVGVLARQGRGGLPRGLGALAIAGGLDLVLLYLAYLASSATLVTVFGGLAAVILGPVFWMWTGSALRRA